MEEVASLLAQETGAPIRDRTELHGKYDFVLYYATLSVPNGESARLWAMRRRIKGDVASNSATEFGSAPNFFAALTAQLGLKLEKKKTSLSVLVIDSARKIPKEN
jgi:uncharacterized protein (TIGR03435 family)